MGVLLVKCTSLQVWILQLQRNGGRGYIEEDIGFYT